MDINKMIDDYVKWLKKEISFSQVGEYYELTTPYLDRFNDYLQIYIKQINDNTIQITDDGYILDNLVSSGVNIHKGPRRSFIERILKSYSLDLDGQKIITTATMENFPQKKHMLIQAMLAIDDMFVTSGENVESFFLDDIEQFFMQHEVFFSKNISLLGKTGSVHKYDFHFQRTKNRPERFCSAINKITESKRNLAIFNWIDSQETRNDEGELIVIINDQKKIPKDHTEAFSTYGIKAVNFGDSEKLLTLCAS